MTTTYSPIAAPVRSAIRAAFALEGGLKPAVDWNFAGGVMPSAPTFARASTATYYDAAGTLVWCPHNLLTYSEQIDNAAWSKLGLGAGSVPVVTANAGTAPDGTTTADRVQLNCVGSTASDRSICNQSVSGLMAGRQYTGAIYVKAYSAGEVGKQLRLFGDSLVTGSIVTLTADWQLVQASGTAAAASGNFGLETRGTSTANTTADFLMWGARLNVDALQPYYPTTSAAYYGPRLTYDPVTHAALGVFVEEQRTNLLTYSEELDNAAWTKNGGASITANVSTAPDGTVTADRLTVVTGASDSLESPGVSITSGTAYTATARLLLGTSATVTLNMSNAAAWSGGVNPSATFNLSTGAITGVAANTTAKVETLPGGWFAVSITATAAATTTSSLRVVPVSSASTTSVWGLQLEAGAFATSYIPTGAASATRAADVVTCTGAAFSQWFNGHEGTFVVEAVMSNATVGSAKIMNIVEVKDASGNESIKVYQYETYFGAAIRHGGAVQADVSGTKTAGVVEKIAVAWAANDAAVAIRGSLVGTDATVAVPTGIDRLTLGTGSPGAVACTIKRVRYWRKRLTNAQLQALTA